MNWALIGYGGMGKWHVKSIRSMPEAFQISGVYDISPQACEAAKADGLRVYPSFADLLDDEEIQLITVATPNDTHMSLAIEAMKHGKHVICEKPIAVSSDELERMIDVSRTTGRFLTVHMNRRWDRDFLTVKKIMDEKALGDIFHIESHVHGSRGIPGDWRKRKIQGGGMILDWGVHLFDQALCLTGEPVIAVQGTATYVGGDEVEDGFIALLTFASGWTASVTVGTNHFISLPRWLVYGRNGTAVVENWELDGRIVKAAGSDTRDAAPVAAAAGLTKTMAPRDTDSVITCPLETVQSDVRDFYRNVRRTIRGEEQSRVTHREIRRVIQLMEVFSQSARINQVIHTRI